MILQTGDSYVPAVRIRHSFTVVVVSSALAPVASFNGPRTVTQCRSNIEECTEQRLGANGTTGRDV